MVLGGLRSALKLRANYIVIRHPDGTYARYYHLMHKGVVVKKGQHVGTGEHIGYSGGTGYSGAPHLHIDIQDRYNKEIAEVRLVTATGNRQLEVAVSNVSARLPNRTESLELNLVRADPFLCTEDLLQRGRLAPDTALFCLRGKSTFAEKAVRRIHFNFSNRVRYLSNREGDVGCGCESRCASVDCD